MSSVLVFAVANGGGPAMVWGVRNSPMRLVMCTYLGWALTTVVGCKRVYSVCRNGSGGVGLCCADIWRGAFR